MDGPFCMNAENDQEILEVVDRDGRVLKTLPRSHIHGDPSLIHRVVHVFVFNPGGELFLQKRSLKKDVAPGKWDTSVGGHMNPGEKPESAAHRELEEELGIQGTALTFLYSYIHTNPYETELVHTYSAVHEGKISFDRDEIDDVKAWSLDEIRRRMGAGFFSDNFEDELEKYVKFTKKGSRVPGFK